MPSSTPAEDRFAARLRGRGPVGMLGAVLVIVLGGVLDPLRGFVVLGWAALSRTPWRELGLARPRSWWATVGGGILLGVTFKLLLKSIVLPLLGADPINHAYHFLVGNRAALLGMLLYMIVGAGFGEELLFRSFLFERFGALWGRTPRARVATVLLTSILFGLAHIPGQGRVGAEQAALVGLAFGSIYAATGGIWLLMIAHAAFDVTAALIIFADLEVKIAHLFFK
jgi:uncharacterized protein